MERIPRPGEIYQHFKGNLYRIIAIAEHSESGEELVIYQALYGEYRVYARPLSMFMEKVDHEKYPQVQTEYRFTRLPLVEIAASPTHEKEISVPVTENSVPAAGSLASANEAETSVCEIKPPAASENNQPAQEEEFVLDPMLLAFLDADSYERKLEIFDSLHGRADQAMLNTIAISLDLELSEGDLEEQYFALRNCMLTLEKYECSRLR